METLVDHLIIRYAAGDECANGVGKNFHLIFQFSTCFLLYISHISTYIKK